MQIADRDNKYKTDLGNLAHSTLSSQVSAVATEMGCVDTKALTRLVDLSTLDVDQETFKADGSGLKMMLEDAQKEMPYLFSKAGPKIDNHNLKAPNLNGNQPDFANMSDAEMIAYAEANDL